MLKQRFLPVLILSVLCFQINHAFAQPAWTINLLDSTKRAKQFEERKLGSEKMAEKKFTMTRHFFQNNFTHYNYYYNANNKINAVIERAKVAQKDDFGRLISFYPYSLDNTATQKTELDSVIYKSTSGILLHDLRNDWIDNMYLLMGKAYFLKKDFDSAAATFQFINYNLFPRKKHEDDNRIVGTNDDVNATTLSIANKEKRNLLKRLTAQPPSRNDALIWISRTLIEQGEFAESAGLINTLQHDPNLPKRLQNDLDEVNAYWFYKQGFYDSAAVYLEKALSNADTKQDKSRSEFLLAQLYEMTHHYDKAAEYYDKSSKHTADALMDIYAQLNNAKLMKGSSAKELDNSIDRLVHMSKKDKFDMYRDILFYSAGDLAMQKPDTNAAISFYKKSLQYNERNASYKNKAFLQLADIAYSRKQYKIASAYYDSLQLSDTSLNDRLAQIKTRKNGLSKIVEKINIIEREDSLQMIAAMAPADRDAFIKKMVKRLRRQKGIKEEENYGSATIDFASINKNEPVDLFSNNSNKGDWYFDNASLKAKGLSDFKRKWGTRSNTDNWRRKSAAENISNSSPTPPDLSDPGNINPDEPKLDPSNKDKDKDNNKGKPKDAGTDPAKSKRTAVATAGSPESDFEDISYEGLMANVPLNPEKLKTSISLAATSLFELGNLYKDELEDYPLAIDTYEKSLQKYPDSLYNGEIYLGLYYCYNKTGNSSKAAYYKNLLTTKFASSHSALLLTNPAAANPDQQNTAGTRRYEAIYTLFIEGKFEDALNEKKKADSLFGKSYWTPQLLYIEAVYHIKQRNDSVATVVLNNIISLYPTSPLKAKAQRLIDVLKRRKEIETYLTDLNVTRAKDDETIKVDDTKAPQTSNNNKTAPAITKPVVDSVKKAVVVATSGPYSFNPSLPQNVVMLLDKVDGTYINESKNALSRYAAGISRENPVTVKKDAIDKDMSLLIFASFPDTGSAMAFLGKIKKAAPDELSWLPANKYSFIIISDDNLERLKTSKNIAGYKALLNTQYPGKF